MSEGQPSAANVSVPVTAKPTPTSANATTKTNTAEGLHTAPLSVLVGALSSLQNAIFPAVAAAFGTGISGAGLFIGLFVGAAIAVIGAIVSYIRWSRLTYTVSQQDIRVESGVLSRAARSVPYERIQDVSLEQKLLPRLFGLVAVKFETGAGGGEDLSLAYLTEDEGERLRQLVRERRDAQDSESVDASDPETTPAKVAEEPAEVIFTMGPRRLFTFGLFEFSLAVFAVLGGLFQYANSFFDFDALDYDEYEQIARDQGGWLFDLGQDAQILTAIGGVIAFFVIGSATGMIRVFTREWGFLLERTPQGFRRRRGLFTKTDVVMPIHRVQGVKIGTGMLRYRFGWHRLRFVSLAQDLGAANHDVAPFAQMDEIAPIVTIAGFHLPGEDADWHRASKSYRNASMVFDGLFFLLGAAAAFVASSINGAVWLQWIAMALGGLAIFSAGAAFYSWRFKRHAIDTTQVMANSGLLSPQSQIANRLKLHSVEISRGPIARWRGYATLHLGQAGGEFEIPGVPIERAREVRREVLKTIAATDFSQLESA